MRAGALDRRVTLQRAAGSAKDPGGALVPGAWADLGRSIAASRTPVSDAEKVRAAQTGATITDRFVVRWADAWRDLDAQDQLVDETDGRRIFGIVGVKEIGRRRGLEITAVARAERAP